MAARRVAHSQPVQTKHVHTHTTSIKAHDVAKVYKTLGLDSEEARRRYLDWYEASRPEVKPNFDIIERGDTLAFE